jgi:hypothetical protein
VAFAAACFENSTSAMSDLACEARHRKELMSPFLEGGLVSAAIHTKFWSNVRAVASGVRPRSGRRLALALPAVWLALTGFASAETFLWGLTSGQRLVRVAASAPGTLLVDVPITGLPSDEHLIAMDVFSSSGDLMGVSNKGKLYTLDRHTGVATYLDWPGATLSAPTGTAFGFSDFRAVLFLFSNDGTAIQMDHAGSGHPYFPITPAGRIVALSSDQVEPVRFVAIDSATDGLYRLNLDGADTLTLIGSLGVDTDDNAGLDDEPVTHTLYAALTVGGLPRLYTVSYTTGQATLIGTIGTTTPVTSLAVDRQGPADVTLDPTSPQPSTDGFPETAGVLRFTVRRNGDDRVPADYHVVTVPEPQLPVESLPTAGQDFVAKNDPLHFDAGEIEKTVTLTLLDDAARERIEYLQLQVIEDLTGAGGFYRITLVDNENQPPVLTMTQPLTNPAFVMTPTITLNGTTTDDEAGVVTKVRHSNGYNWDATSTSTAWEFANIPLEPGINYILLVAEDIYGRTDVEELQVWRAVDTEQTFVFAEGATGDFFDTELLFLNPHPVDAPVTIEFLRDDGTIVPHALTLPAAQRTTLNVESIPGLDAAAMSAVVRTSAPPIVVERTMRWNASGYGAHTEKAAPGASTTWYFAEGSQGFFHTYLLLVNPAATANSVTVRYLREDELPLTRTYEIAPRARLTVDAGADSELVNRSFGMEVTFTLPGVAERAMYFGDNPLWNGGHESAGVTALSNSWFLAEGATGTFFETFVLMSNPSTTAAAVTLTFLTDAGTTVRRMKSIPAGGRVTVNIEQEDAALANAAVATTVESSVPIVVERAQYWPGPPSEWYEAHGSFGVTQTDLHWGLAEGRVGGPENWQTYILLANPSHSRLTATLRFFQQSGTVVTKQFTLEPASRFNVAVPSDHVPELTSGSFGVEITSNGLIAVERAMYRDANGQTWAAGTNATATRLP